MVSSQSVPTFGMKPVGVKVEKESKWGPIAAIIGALAVVLVTIVTLRTSFPVPYYVAAILLLLAFFSLLFYKFCICEPINTTSQVYKGVKQK